MELLALLLLVAAVATVLMLAGGHARSSRAPGWRVRRSPLCDTTSRLWWPEIEEPVPRDAGRAQRCLTLMNAYLTRRPSD